MGDFSRFSPTARLLTWSRLEFVLKLKSWSARGLEPRGKWPHFMSSSSGELHGTTTTRSLHWRFLKWNSNNSTKCCYFRPTCLLVASSGIIFVNSHHHQNRGKIFGSHRRNGGHEASEKTGVFAPIFFHVYENVVEKGWKHVYNRPDRHHLFSPFASFCFWFLASWMLWLFQKRNKIILKIEGKLPDILKIASLQNSQVKGGGIFIFFKATRPFWHFTVLEFRLPWTRPCDLIKAADIVDVNRSDDAGNGNGNYSSEQN